MRILLGIFFGALGVFISECQTIQITPNSDPVGSSDLTIPGALHHRAITAGEIVLGYVACAAPNQIQAILDSAASPKLGDCISLPVETQRFYLPPRQEYVLIEPVSGQLLIIWPLSRRPTRENDQSVIPISGAIARPDQTSFSPRGDAAVLYTATTDHLQVITGLPSHPSVRDFFLDPVGILSCISVSDDGLAVIAQLNDGSLVSSWGGTAWRPVPLLAAAPTWSFVARSHDLVVADSLRKTLSLISNFKGAWKESRLLAEDVLMDELLSTKAGDRVIGANTATNCVWVVELKTGEITVYQSNSKIDALSYLRNGTSFLLSAHPIISILKLAEVVESRHRGS